VCWRSVAVVDDEALRQFSARNSRIAGVMFSKASVGPGQVRVSPIEFERLGTLEHDS